MTEPNIIRNHLRQSGRYQVKLKEEHWYGFEGFQTMRDAIGVLHTYIGWEGAEVYRNDTYMGRIDDNGELVTDGRTVV